jgi:hypothetical protein
MYFWRGSTGARGCLDRRRSHATSLRGLNVLYSTPQLQKLCSKSTRCNQNVNHLCPAAGFLVDSWTGGHSSRHTMLLIGGGELIAAIEEREERCF